MAKASICYAQPTELEGWLGRPSGRSSHQYAMGPSVHLQVEMRVFSWNLRRATRKSAVWERILEEGPDIALLQEVGGVPKQVRSAFDLSLRPAMGKLGHPQRFSTALLVKGTTRAGSAPLGGCWTRSSRPGLSCSARPIRCFGCRPTSRNGYGSLWRRRIGYQPPDACLGVTRS